jgi:deoxyribodipyrimidine photo-lyase
MSALVWFRRDLRLHDHAALYHALKRHQQVHCVFVFDRDILDKLLSKEDRRVEFIWQSVRELKLELRSHGGDLHVLHDSAPTAVSRLAKILAVEAVYTNTDYEPQAIARDKQVQSTLHAAGVGFNAFKDTVIFEKDEVLTLQAKPFSVFTPYKNAWLKKLSSFYLSAYPVERYVSNLAKVSQELPMPELAALGFSSGLLAPLKMAGGVKSAQALLNDFASRMAHYKDARDFPAIKGVSYLSVHNRFGTCSIRALASAAHSAWQANQDNIGALTWLSELIWRDFYFQILWHHPRVVSSSFRPEYDQVQWENSADYFHAWCEARTGYPIIDAAMRQLNQTGYMHNRLRMIVASFLTKDLLVDWRWGEGYFAEHLIDFDLAANNGGWQWAASTGCDAQPYFRIFNPISQSERFDPAGKFIRRYLPELNAVPDKLLHSPWLASPNERGTYPLPIVDHAEQRTKALAMYKIALA